MAWVVSSVGTALVGGVGSLISGAMQADAADDAAQMQLQASREANALQERMWNDQKRIQEEARTQQRADFEPWRTAGTGALAGMGDADFKRDFTAADFQQDPGYAFRMQEGQKALERSAAARGGLQSGGTMKALAQYGQNFASNEYQNAYNRFNSDRDRRFSRLSSIANMGQASAAGMANASGNYAGQMGQMGSNYANAVGNNTMGAANAAGASRMAGAQAWGNAIAGVGKAGMDAASLGMQDKWMSKWTG